MSDTEHVAVWDRDPVRIGDGPEISTRGADIVWPVAVVRVNGEPVYVNITYPEPFDIPGTPYEGYTRGHWEVGTFAIRLKGEERP